MAEPAPQVYCRADGRVSVWACAQQPGPVQRRNRYLPESAAHPAKMLPALARQAIATYTTPGELVADPMCGIGTTVVEAVHLGRDGLGVDFEPRWAALAQANVDLARSQGATGRARVLCGDSRRLADLVEPQLRGRAALVLTSPPYGASVHGHVRSTRDTGQPGLRKTNHQYSRDPANLAHRRLDELLAGLSEILTGCRRLLRPGGIVAITARPFRAGGQLVDFPGAVWQAAEAAGLEPVERLVVLLAGVRGGRLVPRASFFQLEAVRKARARGVPLRVIAHEDLLILRTPTPPSVAACAQVVPLRPDNQGHAARGDATDRAVVHHGKAVAA
jgi:modification methylase